MIPPTNKRGLVIVISGPSGVGKDTLIKRLLELDHNLRYSVSCTTRPPRPGEVDGVDYTFVSRERFQELIDAGAFLEFAEYDGNLYGTLLERVERAQADGHDIVLKIEVKGAEQMTPQAKEWPRRSTFRCSFSGRASVMKGISPITMSAIGFATTSFTAAKTTTAAMAPPA